MRSFYQLSDLDGSNPYTLSLAAYREDFQTPNRLAMPNPIGADGAYDLHGDRRAPKDRASADLEFSLIAASTTALQTAINSLMAAVEGTTRDLGRRKLWRREVSDSSAARWTYAKAAARPALNFAGPLLARATVRLELPEPFLYDSLTTAWLTANGYTAETLASTVVGEPIAPDYTFAVFTVTTTPFAFNLINNGDLECHRCVFRFASQAVNGFTNPKIENLTNGQQFSSTTDGATAATVLSVNSAPGLGRARLSTDGGGTWTDDTPNVTPGSLQAVLMELQPGSNSMRYTDGGTPNLKLYIWWLHSWRD